MESIFAGDINFSDVKDPIKTEETIYEQIKNLDFPIPYVGVPLAFRLNSRGISDTQALIDSINSEYPFRKFFVCQHILVNQLNFGDNIVFTPHTINSDPYQFIPHYNPIFHYKENLKKINDRNLDFSFIGDFGTNVMRDEISKIDIKNCIIEPTGQWFFSQSQDRQIHLKHRYVEVLKDTKFPLCPPGTGPSTLRFFESLSVGGIPIILNDMKLPKDLDALVLKSSIDDIRNGKIYDFLNIQEIDEISEKIHSLYWNNYSNDNLSACILKYFN